MADWTQANRPFRLETPLGPDVLLLERWEGEERISAFYHYTVEAISTRGDITARELLLKQATLRLRLPDGSDRTIHGIISRVTRGGEAVAGVTSYQLEIVPPQWAFTLDRGFDLFQDQSAREVCKKLLEGPPHEWRLVRTLAPRPYTFRYRESRWQCVARLLEQEGIWFRYDHKSGKAVLILGDNTGSAQPAWQVSTLAYNPINDGSASGTPFLSALAMEGHPYVAKTRVRSASEFTHGKSIVDEVAAGGTFAPPADLIAYAFDQQAAAHRTGITHNGGDNGGDAAKLLDDMKVYARLRQEQDEAQAIRFLGRSRYTGLEVGARTEVTGHPDAAMNAALFITRVQHTGSNGSYFAGDGQQAFYENLFEAIPADTPYRPPRVTAWPRVAGAHVGTVVGPAGEEIYTDKHGRVQVVFKWDTDGATSLSRACWIRVAQPFAGQTFGAVFLPRIGHEVLVDFLDGNPDNPIVVGSLYNNANLPPWPLPEHKTRSGLRTKSTLHGGADEFNELRFEDKKGEEEVYLQAQKYLNTYVKRSERRKVDLNRRTLIGNDDEKVVQKGHDHVTVEEGEQVITVKANNRTLHVERDHTVTVNGNEQVSVTKDRAVTVSGAQQVTVSGNQTIAVKGKQAVTVTGNDTVKVEQGNASRTVAMGNIEEKASLGNITVKADLGKITLEAMQGIELKVGMNSILIDMSGITIKGIMVKVEGQAMAQIKAPMTQVNGDAMVMVKGAITMIN